MQGQAHLLIQLLILAIPERRTEHDAVKVVFIESTESAGALQFRSGYGHLPPPTLRAPEGCQRGQLVRCAGRLACHCFPPEAKEKARTRRA